MKKWANSRGGAVLPPLEEEELRSQVKYVGVFPELVEHMITNMLDAEESNGKNPPKILS
jgi:hypothetical protein